MTARDPASADTVWLMTDQAEHLEGHPTTESHDAVIAEALAVIDQTLGKIMGRDLVSSGEVADLLLDVRTLLTSAPAEPETV